MTPRQVNQILRSASRESRTSSSWTARPSVEPTRHLIDVEVGRRWTWCALDAVGIVGALGAGVIYSQTTSEEGRASHYGRTVRTIKSGRLHRRRLRDDLLCGRVVSDGQLLLQYRSCRRLDGSSRGAGQSDDRVFHSPTNGRRMAHGPRLSNSLTVSAVREDATAPMGARESIW